MPVGVGRCGTEMASRRDRRVVRPALVTDDPLGYLDHGALRCRPGHLRADTPQSCQEGQRSAGAASAELYAEQVSGGLHAFPPPLPPA